MQGSSRHNARKFAFAHLFSHVLSTEEGEDLDNAIRETYHLERVDTGFSEKLVEGVTEHRDAIHALINQYAPEWPIEQIDPVDRTCLEIALYELMFAHDDSVPPKVAVDEAIEIAKEFGDENSGSFVNGVLGSLVDEHHMVTKDTEKETEEPTHE